jgi:hypothetical protein
MYKFNRGEKAYIIENSNPAFCPNPDRIGELVTIDEESKMPNFYYLEEFPGLWPAGCLVKAED